jgi:hypothetical protein
MTIYDVSWRWGSAIWVSVVLYSIAIQKYDIFDVMLLSISTAIMWTASTYISAAIYRKLNLPSQYEWVILILGGLLINNINRQLLMPYY